MIKKFLKRRTFVDLLFILILGLTPLLWFQPGFLAFGHDMGFPLNPVEHFQDRLFTWTERLSLGADQSMNVGAFFIHGFEALIKWLGFSLQSTQKIAFVFWFVTPGLAMYYFIRSLGLQKKLPFLPLMASIFYMFNHFLLQGWFIAERTKFSIIVALPLVLSFLIRGLQQKMSLLKAAVLVNLVLFFFNGGGGQGLPLYGGLMVSIGVCLIHFGRLKRTVLLTALVLFLFIFLNFYWILPFSRFASANYSQGLASIGGMVGVLDWTRDISKYASFLNLLRLQGIPAWYDNPAHPYANLFLEFPPLIIISFLWPLFAFASVLLAKSQKEKKYVLFFALLALISMFFTAGSHPPMGGLYEAFIKYVPLFAIFRTPFYKFGYVLWFAYAFLISFAVSKLLMGFKKKWVSNSLFFVFIVFILFYNYPFFTGSFFNWNPPLNTMVKVPNYVFEFGKWVDSLGEGGRVLMLPPLNKDQKADVYNWQYWSLATVPSLLTRKSVIANTSELDRSQIKLMEGLYSALWEQDETLARKLVSILNVKYFLLRKDAFFGLNWCPTVPPSEWQEKLKTLDWIKLDHEFGEWLVYRLEISEFIPHFSAAQFFSFSHRALTPFIPFILNELNSKETLIPLEEGTLLLNRPSKIYILAQPHSRGETGKPDVASARFLPYGRFYFLVDWKERLLEKKVKLGGNSEEILNLNLGLANKRLQEIRALMERRWLIKQDMIFTTKEDDPVIESKLEVTPEIIKIETSKKMTWERFDERLEETLAVIKEIEAQDGDILKAELRLLQYLKIWQQQFFYFLIKENQFYSDTSSRFQTLLTIESELEDKTWVSKNELESRYLFEIPKEGEYDLFSYINKADQSIDYRQKMFAKSPVPLSLNIDGEGVAMVVDEGGGDNWESLGNYQLDAGDHQLQVFWPEVFNLAQEEDFILSAGEAEFSFLMPDNFLEKGQSFSLSFDFKVEGKDMPRLMAHETLRGKEGETVFPVINTLLPRNEYQLKFSENFDIDPRAKQAGVKLYFENYSESQVLISNFRLTRRWEPVEMVFREKEEQDAFLTPQIAFRRINATKYEVQVQEAKEPYLLLFPESFNPNWKVYPKEATLREMFASWERKSIPEERHLVANGYANSWYIRPEDVGEKENYKLIIEFWPQKLFYIGLVFSGFTLMSCLGILGWFCLKKKR